jgi:hypothetical protein
VTSGAFAVVQWAAREAPTVRRKDGKADTVAHHVLVCLALYADRGGVARPSLPTLAHDARLVLRSTEEALARLVDGGLIAKQGDLNGTTVWRLNTAVRRDASELSEASERAATARQKHAERARRYRTRQATLQSVKGGRDAEVERHVTPNQSVTQATVTPNLNARDAEVERHVTPNQSVTQATVTPNLNARDAVVERHVRSASTHVTPSTPSHLQVAAAVTAIEQPYELPGTANTPREAFDHFWAAYPRKVGRKAAEQAFTRTVQKRQATVEALIAHAERWAALWAAEGREERYIPHAATWLNGERWNDTPPAPRRPPRPDIRPSTTDARVAAALALAQRYDDDTPRQITGGHAS